MTATRRALVPAAVVSWISLGLAPIAVADPIVPVDGRIFTSSVVFVTAVYDFPHGVSIGASGITLDMNGATLSASGLNGYGVTCVDHDDVVLMNGVVRGFYYGIQVQSVA